MFVIEGIYCISSGDTLKNEESRSQNYFLFSKLLIILSANFTCSVKDSLPPKREFEVGEWLVKTLASSSSNTFFVSQTIVDQILSINSAQTLLQNSSFELKLFK